MHYYTDVLKKYAVFDGRATRKEFWMFALWNVIIYVVLAIVIGVLMGSTNNSTFVWIYVLYVLATLLPSIGLVIRRLHDTGRSGWWIFINFVPFIGSIVLLVFYLEDSRPDNQYGPNPKNLAVAPV